MRKILLSLILLLMATPVFAQAIGQPKSVASVNGSVKITTGATYQQILAAVTGAPGRQSVTIQNNNASDACLIDPTGTVTVGSTTASTFTIGGVSLTAAQASISLAAGQSYTRYYPLTPRDKITGTCNTTGSSLYVDTQ